MKVVVINGSAGVGKDTFCHLVSLHCESRSFSSVDTVKRLAVLAGWDGKKDEKGRSFISDLKRITTKYNDFSMRYLIDCVSQCANKGVKIVFLHIREPEEIKRAVEVFGAYTLLITNRNIKQVTSNQSDANVQNYDYDYYVDNSGTKAELGQKAVEFIAQMEGE